MPVGSVNFWYDAAGYGTITPTDGGQAVFVHWSQIQTEKYASLTKGELVEFDMGNGIRGPIAINVRSPGLPSQPALLAGIRSERLRPDFGVAHFSAGSVRELEYEINSWASTERLRVVGAVVISEGEGLLSALVTYAPE